MTAPLDGHWLVRRTGGLLPPIVGVTKRVDGDRGETRLGPLRLPFRVDGDELRYAGPLGWVVDRVRPDGEGWSGRTFVLGREIGRFELRRR